MRAVDGVLIPDELADATDEELKAYAAEVRKSNAQFIAAYFKLEDEAARLGIDLEDRRG